MAAILMMAAIGAWMTTTGQLSYVVTYGISMNPVYHADDLVVLLKSDSYELGQIAAYHGGAGQTEVLHRIVGGDSAAGYVLRGDNNESVDVATPTTDEMIGRAVLHIPGGGKWLQPLLSPTGLGMLGFLFVSGGTAVAKNRREVRRGRRKKRAKGMSGGGGSLATAAAVLKAVSRLHPALRALAATAAACGIAGLTLGVLGWMKPAIGTAASTSKTAETMFFSYSAEVGRSAAYDGTTVYSPDPVFRRLASRVDLSMQYRGEPGSIQIIARLAAQNGWHKTLQLSQQKRFTTNSYTDNVQLDLNALETRAEAAGDAIGAEMGALTLTVTAQVQHDNAAKFEPRITFNMAPLQLTLASSPESLTVRQSDTGTLLRERQIGAFGFNLLTATEARRYTIYLITVALIGAGIVAWMALGRVPLRTRAQIQRRYPHLLVPVEPMASPPGKPIVIVDTFPALVKLAEKYGQMILTWTRPDGADDFVVRDEGILYRYRIEATASASESSPAAPKPRVATRRVEKPTPDRVTSSPDPVTSPADSVASPAAAAPAESAGAGSSGEPSSAEKPSTPTWTTPSAERAEPPNGTPPDVASESGETTATSATPAPSATAAAATAATSATAATATKAPARTKTPARKRTTEAAAPAKTPAKAVAKRSRAKAKAAAVRPGAESDQSIIAVSEIISASDLPPFGPGETAPLEIPDAGSARVAPKLSAAEPVEVERPAAEIAGSVEPSAPESIEELEKELDQLAYEAAAETPRDSVPHSGPETDTDPTVPPPDNKAGEARRSPRKRASRRKPHPVSTPPPSEEADQRATGEVPRTVAAEAEQAVRGKVERTVAEQAERTVAGQAEPTVAGQMEPTEPSFTRTGERVEAEPSADRERNAEAAREAMADLAERNRPVHAQEPIYDFLPPEKRPGAAPSDDEPDVAEPDVAETCGADGETAKRSG